MNEPLRPHFALASTRIQSVVARRAGGYAVATETGIELFDDALAPAGRIAGEVYGNLDELADGRFVLHKPGLFVASSAGVEQPDVGEFLQSIVLAPDGFFAFGPKCLVVDRAGTRTRIELAAERINGGSAAWRDGVAVSGRTGLTLLEAAGAERARSDEVYLTKRPVVLGDVIAVPGLHAIHLFDESARAIGEIAIDVAERGAHAFARGLLVHANEGFVVYLEHEAATWTERWRHPMPEYGDLYIAGEHAVISGGERATILDARGAVRGETGWAQGAEPFGGGIALCGETLMWWRDGEDVVDLPHDVTPDLMRAVPAGLVTTEDNVLLVWRTDLQGPVVENVTTDMPLETPIVVDGVLLVIEGTARFSIVARRLNGMPVPLRPGTHRWRPLATREQAMQAVERLIGRVFDGPRPAVPTEGTHDTTSRELAHLPISETVDLFGRAMFAASSLEPAVLERVGWARDAFFEELAAVLATKPRLLAAAIRARKLRLDPPRPAAGYDYLGTFTTSGALTVADPAYVGRKNPPGAFSLSLKIKAAEGLWHVFVRPAAKDASRNAELSVVHEDAFATSASVHAGTIGVDSGCAGVFDRACPKRDANGPLEEGLISGLGAIAWSGYGDGGYPVFVGRNAGVVTKIRISFIDDQPEIDRLIASSSAAKPYSAATTFTLGDAIEHVKFGRGSVIRIEDGKIHVRFADATRTLVHGRR